MLPKDPFILLSLLNLKLRDNYSSLDELCQDMDISLEECLDTIRTAGLIYDKDKNCVRER